jgi:hypothetical protein
MIVVCIIVIVASLASAVLARSSLSRRWSLTLLRCAHSTAVAAHMVVIRCMTSSGCIVHAFFTSLIISPANIIRQDATVA